MSRCRVLPPLALATFVGMVAPACAAPERDRGPARPRSPAPEVLAAELDCGCGDVRAPVCGVDRRTHDSACAAGCAGVEVLHDGPCGQACAANGECGEGEFCDFGTDCGEEGTCRSLLDGCERVYEPPVCGCDGRDYAGVCVAHGQGVSVAAMGQCECENDRWEPNDEPGGGAVLAMDPGDEYGTYLQERAFLCAGEDDWYLISYAAVDQAYLGGVIEVVVNGDFCACDGFLPAAPENTIGVEVRDAETFALRSGEVAENGRVVVPVGPPGRDLLIRVHGPTAAATFDYGLFILLGEWHWGDDCAC